MSNKTQVAFPKKKVISNRYGESTFVYHPKFINSFNKKMDTLQKFLDNRVIIELQKYVSKKEGIQKKSIRLYTQAGSGLVIIGVKYAEYQAYSKRIKKRVGKRGTYPFERMVNKEGKAIFRALNNKARELNGK